jgi:hypothetical protein
MTNGRCGCNLAAAGVKMGEYRNKTTRQRVDFHPAHHRSVVRGFAITNEPPVESMLLHFFV